MSRRQHCNNACYMVKYHCRKLVILLTKRLFIIITLICVIISLTACGEKTETPSIPAPEEMSGIPGDVLIPDADETLTSEPEASAEPSEPEPSKIPTTTSTPAGTTSRPTTPPANNTPSQAPAQPATSTPAPPASSTPTPSQPTKPTYTEADYQAIISEIRAYGEAKGFVWDDSFAFGQAGLGYYGRPNLTDLSKESVISDLKYHCDKIETYVGGCHFKVVRHDYQNKVEFVVLYG